MFKLYSFYTFAGKTFDSTTVFPFKRLFSWLSLLYSIYTLILLLFTLLIYFLFISYWQPQQILLHLQLKNIWSKIHVYDRRQTNIR
jgi:hypothetical protein